MTVDARRLFAPLDMTDARDRPLWPQAAPLLASLRVETAGANPATADAAATLPLPALAARRWRVPTMALDEVERWFG